MFAARRADRLSLSAPAMRTVLDGIASRLDEQREVSRYMIGLLIFLGLLGTFWGLLLTIASISDVIGNMSVGSGDLNQLFNQLKAGLAQPLRGMGTAFSASMLGLAGALVLGFLCLVAFPVMLLGLVPLLGWLNYLVIPLAVLGAALGALSDSSTGRNLNLVVLLVGFVRLWLGGFIL